MDSELRALCEAAHQCNTWAREFAESYSRCDDAPREVEGGLPDYWGCGSRAQTRLRNAQRLLEKLESVVREFSDSDYDDAWSCIEQAVNNDQPQRYIVGSETHIVAHKAAFAQAEYVLSSASELGMSAIIEELTLKDCFETIKDAAEKFNGMQFDDLRALIRRESDIAIEVIEKRLAQSDDTGDRAASTQLKPSLPKDGSTVSPDNVPAEFREHKKPDGAILSSTYLISSSEWPFNGVKELTVAYQNGRLTHRIKVGRAFAYLNDELAALWREDSLRD